MLISEKNYDDDDVWCLEIFYRNFQKKIKSNRIVL